MEKKVYIYPLTEVVSFNTEEMMTVAGESEIQHIPEPGSAPARKSPPIF